MFRRLASRLQDLCQTTAQKKAKSRRSSFAKPRRLAAEHLSERLLMAADISLDNVGVLHIEGDNTSEAISVSTGHQYVANPFFRGRPLPIPSIFVEVEDLETGRTQRETFLRSEVTGIDINANGGNDTVDLRGYQKPPSYIVPPAITVDGSFGNDTIYGSNLPETIHGGTHDDTIYGYGGADRIFGGSSDDTIYGGADDDVIYGGHGQDVIRGGSGHDDLFGGSGIDVIYGNSGNDQLFGGTHMDFLFGDAGHDSMFGGQGRDYYTGGTGNDRFLVTANDSYRFLDKRSWDAKITFENSTSNFVLDNVTYYASSWSEWDVHQVDEAMQLLVNMTGSNTLLRQSNGDDVTFVRRGGDNDPQKQVNGWNHEKKIIITANAFLPNPELASGSYLNSAVIHELAHFWDEPGENIFISEFRDTAGWREIAPWDFWTSRTGLSEATGKNDWWFETTAANQFARPYGMTNPLEDWATAMTAYVMTENNLPYAINGSEETIAETRDRMATKFEILDRFFASLP